MEDEGNTGIDRYVKAVVAPALFKIAQDGTTNDVLDLRGRIPSLGRVSLRRRLMAMCLTTY